jgi:catechol 2,3-dioxygenase-like lactoylglutathione lyase family enzyme
MQTKLDLKSLILGSVLTAAVMLSLAATTANQETNRATPATGDNQIERVNGIGGVFFKVRDPKKMRAWYRDHLGIDATKAGYVNFDWREKDNPDRLGRTVWTLFPTNSTYFTAPLMINYRVANLDRMLAQLRRDGVEVAKTQDFDYGRFAWITDPEGNRIELWEPKGK